MNIKILTLFPNMFDGFLSNSIVKRAIAAGVVNVEIINIRDYTLDKYGRVDTPPIGGGAGLVMKCQPIVDAIKANDNSSYKVIMSPRGKTFNQSMAVSMSKMSDVMLICGHYEGIDERVNEYVDDSISTGDYILTGGELPSMIISDAIIRLLDGAITAESLDEESFSNGLLEYPQYTEPRDFNGSVVPDILYTGNHSAIEKYRKKESLRLTKKYRPDLFEKYNLSKQDIKLLKELESDEEPKWLTQALEKGKKFTRKDL